MQIVSIQESRKTMQIPRTVLMTCGSECCQGKTTKHDYNRTADDGRRMYTCRECGEERSQK